ncbi:MAG: hypothetical protein OHK93_000864 [Ramalina farinacea]|uniref:Uncharacterized protein n=1 Tax=Ramalina farinacea TaxID=258253 RepID=A0AA43QND8_9LECA|nr:hypothetical protein [Ramalina farinacea]
MENGRRQSSDVRQARSCDKLSADQESIERTSLEIESSSTNSLEAEDTIADIQLHYQQRLKSLYEIPQDSAQIASATISNHEEYTIVENTQNDDAFEFRLFASDSTKEPAEHTITTSKIRLDSPGSGNDAPGFVLPRRPESLYFAGEATGQKAQDYQYAAVTAEDVLKYATIKWVRSLWADSSPRTIQAPKSTFDPKVRDHPHSATRKRHGKKRRIVLRQRIVQAKEREAKARTSKEESTEAEKEKRNRMNRERKVKRRQKERDRKATERRGDG